MDCTVYCCALYVLYYFACFLHGAYSIFCAVEYVVLLAILLNWNTVEGALKLYTNLILDDDEGELGHLGTIKKLPSHSLTQINERYCEHQELRF